MDHSNIGVVEGGRSPGFLKEALFVFSGDIQIIGQEFESDSALEFEVEGFVDDAHATDAGSAEDSVPTNLLVYGQRPRGRVHCKLQPIVLRRGGPLLLYKTEKKFFLAPGRGESYLWRQVVASKRREGSQFGKSASIGGPAAAKSPDYARMTASGLPRAWSGGSDICTLTVTDCLGTKPKDATASERRQSKNYPLGLAPST